MEDPAGARPRSVVWFLMGQAQSGRGPGLDRSLKVKKNRRSKHILLTEWVWAARKSPM